ncbi:MAG: ferrous iron transport protein A [Gemmatales bacterium]|nr:ferrous iron transport protein A [Gemmatales bacterium]MDW8223663.1 FeoA family protein [Gemmatales bacterium]
MRVKLPLEELERGELAEVALVEGDTAWVARMAELGIRPGQQVRMLQPGSPCLISLGAARLSLRLGRMGRVLVTPASVYAYDEGQPSTYRES